MPGIARLPRVALVLAATLALAAATARGAAGAASAPALTIVADPGPFGAVEVAAGADSRVDWWDTDPTDDDACTESFAATELRRFLPRCMGLAAAGIVLAPARALPRSGDVILLGRAAALARPLRGPEPPAFPGTSREAYRMEVLEAGGRRIYVIEGAGRAGTLYGAYAFLERLGLRFFGLGETGTVYPDAPSPLPDTLRVAESPGFATRGFWTWESRGNAEFFLWMARNRMNLWTAAEHDPAFLKKLGFQLTAGGHLVEKTLLDPDAGYPYRHAGFDDGVSRPPDPYPAGPEYAGDRNHDGKLSYFEARPEWYGLVAGRRSNQVGLETGDNYCTSNADATRELAHNLVRQLASGAWRHADILVFWMLDNGSWCECAPCAVQGQPTDRLLAVLGTVLDTLRAAEARQGLRPIQVTSLAFLETLPPPTRPVPQALADADFAMTYFPIDRCYVHALADTACSEINALQLARYRAWATDSARLYRGATAVGEYYNLDAFKSLPMVLTRVIGADVPWYYAHGARHFSTMHAPTSLWGPWTLDHRLLARLLWSPAGDAGPIAGEYFTRYYPASRAHAAAFYADLEKAMSNFKLIKHRVFVGGGVYQLAKRLRRNQNPYVTHHFQYHAVTARTNDGPDMEDIVAAVRHGRLELDAARRVAAGAEAARLAEDERRFAYLEATVDFIDGVLYINDARHYHLDAQARARWPALEAAAARLRGMVDVVQTSGSHANAADGFEATGWTDIYRVYERAYGGPRR